MQLGKTKLSIDDVYNIAVREEKINISATALKKVRDANKRLNSWIDTGRTIYGVNTGFGELVNHHISKENINDLQYNLIRSHAAGQGGDFSPEVCRSIITARLTYLVQGYSGVSEELIILLTDFLNKNIIPVIPQQGSVGASGDLVPLSHLALALIGEGLAFYKGEKVRIADAMAKEELKPINLGAKEGIAMINGTSAMTGASIIALKRAENLLKTAVLASSLVIETLEGSEQPYKEIGHVLKHHQGQQKVAALIRKAIKNSLLIRSEKKLVQCIMQSIDTNATVSCSDAFLQDAYSLRCTPQILGPVADTLNFVRINIENELNSCNDNPLLFEKLEDIFHGGNFHGQYLAMSCDYMNIAIAEIGVLAERQLNRLLDPHLNKSLPPFLAYENAGLTCGFEGAQYLATSIVSENFDLAAPSSIKSISSNGSNQDIVSMGLIAARKSLTLTENVENILNMLLTACLQAAVIHGKDKYGVLTGEFISIAPDLFPYRDDYPFNELFNRIKVFTDSAEFKKWLDSNFSVTEKA